MPGAGGGGIPHSPPRRHALLGGPVRRVRAEGSGARARRAHPGADTRGSALDRGTGARGSPGDRSGGEGVAGVSAMDWLRATACVVLLAGCTRETEVAESADSRRAAAAAGTGFAA